MRDRLSRIPLALALIAGAGAAAAGASSAATATAGPRASVSTGRSCYVVGQRVSVHGSGFAAASPYDIAIDGVDFGQSETDAAGAFTAALRPGGLPAGVVQAVDSLDASDGTHEARTAFTLTRSTGALFTTSRGPAAKRRGRFETWDVGSDRLVYAHYVHGTAAAATRTVTLGRSSGACGALRTGRRALFPFAPAGGEWTVQFDTRADYSPHPAGAVARLRIAVG